LQRVWRTPCEPGWRGATSRVGAAIDRPASHHSSQYQAMAYRSAWPGNRKAVAPVILLDALPFEQVPSAFYASIYGVLDEFREAKPLFHTRLLTPLHEGEGRALSIACRSWRKVPAAEPALARVCKPSTAGMPLAASIRAHA
jgi:hypothetical protein